MFLFQIAMIIILLSVVFWLACLTFAQIFGAPTVYSSSKAVEDCLKLASLKEGELIVDLGCGNARVLITAAKEFGAKGIGTDRSPYCFLKSKLNVFLAGESKNIKIFFGPFIKIENRITKADVVYLYLLNRVNRKIEDWLFNNISKDTRVVSLAFDFEKHIPKKEIETRTLGRKTKARLY